MILVLDNYDSFTYNLAHGLEEAALGEVVGDEVGDDLGVGL